MATRTPKALFHPDGGLFVLWHPTLHAYCPVISDEDVPPSAVDLDLNDTSITRQENLVWLPIYLEVERTIRTIVEDEAVLFRYDSETGEEAP